MVSEYKQLERDLTALERRISDEQTTLDGFRESVLRKRFGKTQGRGEELERCVETRLGPCSLRILPIQDKMEVGTWWRL